MSGIGLVACHSFLVRGACVCFLVDGAGSLLSPFEENGLPFCVPGVLHQRSEVVLWKLLSIQMIF